LGLIGVAVGALLIVVGQFNECCLTATKELVSHAIESVA
jgi:hypothetical protein